MPKDMHDYVNKKIITTFRRYPTTVQDTLLRIIGDELQETYDLTDTFTDIMLSPDNLRPDIIKAKAKQYNFDIREEASLSEQIKLLEAINVINSKRGSIESIEKMWTYYGGNLPKNVKIDIPAHNIFRYSISKFSGLDRFQDNNYYRSGVYNINVDGDYDLKSLRDFVNKELVAAGTKVNYIKRMQPLFPKDDKESGMSADNVYSNYILFTDLLVSLNRSGLTWSTYSQYNTWSGKANIFVDIYRLYDLGIISIGDITTLELYYYTEKSTLVLASVSNSLESTTINFNLKAISTPTEAQMSADQHFYDTEGNEINTSSNYPGYFVLGSTLLGEVIK